MKPGTDKVPLTGVKWSLLIPLYHRALDAGARHPLLGDDTALHAVQTLDYDFGHPAMRLTRADRYAAVLRARQLDRWCADFLARRPDAVVLQLGCGLDTRVHRVARPAGVDWYDVDFPEVLALRERLFPDPGPGYHPVATSVTYPTWFEQIPADRPVLVIAEGLLARLTEPEVRTLVDRLLARFPGGGEILFDALTSWITRPVRLLPSPDAGYELAFGVRQDETLDSWSPRLRHLEDVSVVSLFPAVPSPLTRTLYRALAASPRLRDAARLFRLSF